MKTLPVLIRREFWEHRVLWIAPLVVAILYIVMCLIPVGFNPGGIDMGDASISGSRDPSFLLVAGIQTTFTVLLLLLMSVVAFYYLSDCLYAERKDRSILFWKSLPVSDTATVLSKLLVALLVLPLGVYALALVTNMLAFGILYARFHNSPLVQHFVRWDTSVWLRLNLLLVADIVVLALWYAPVAAYQLLISAWAKSSVFVWTILPPLVLILGEKLVFGTWNVAQLIGYRLGTGMSDLAGSGFGLAADHHGPDGLEGLLDQVNLLPLLGTAGLWIGVVVAGALVFAAIRIRRYRDDS
jgi:ABC-2 type transport system permease protein